MKDLFTGEEHMSVFVVVAFAVLLFLLVVVEHTRKEQATGCIDCRDQSSSQDLLIAFAPPPAMNTQVPATPVPTAIGNGYYAFQGRIGVM
jgi:hypothetical protein